jgi:hypothetical protein
VALPREERLLDLTWEWSFSRRMGVEMTGQRHLYLQGEIATHSRAIFGTEVRPETMEQVVELLHDEAFLSRAAFAAGTHPNFGNGRDDEENPATFALSHLRDADVFARGQEFIRVEPAADRGSLLNLQAALVRKVASRGLVVEINPSSNLLIAHLGNLSNHPVFRLLAADGSAEAPAVPVCLGSDDPTTFATRLRAEFQYLQDAAVSVTGSTSAGAAWLDQLRDTGLAVRFGLQPDPTRTPKTHTHLTMAPVPLPP